MLLTTKQAAEKLGLTVYMLKTRLKNGEIKSANAPTDGKKKVNHLFDSKVVAAFAKENPKTKRGRKSSNSTTDEPSVKGVFSSIVNRLDSLEDKIDSLINLWK